MMDRLPIRAAISAPYRRYDGALLIRFVGACAALFLECSASPAEEQEPRLDGDVKAAFLYKFPAYVEWPASAFPQPEAPITIGVIGADTVAAELLEIVRGRGVDQRPFAVRKVKDGESLDGLNILFIGPATSARLSQLLNAARQRAILTVTESDRGLAQGSVINFLVVDGRLRFQVSRESAEKSGLKLSSRMLSVAYNPRPGTP